MTVSMILGAALAVVVGGAFQIKDGSRLEASRPITCVVEIPSGATECARPCNSDRLRAGEFLVSGIVTDVDYDPERSFVRVALAIANDHHQPLGTSDGRTPVGFRVFVTGSTLPLVTAYGRRTLNGGDHPYVHYPEIVAPGDTSSARAWEWDVPPGESRLSFTVRVQARFPGDVEIPAEPPDGWINPEDSAGALFARENMVFVHPRMSGPYLRNVVQVRFHPDSALDERQAAIDLVDGVVIAGDRRFYWVQIPDRTGDPWWAIDLLERLEQVADVFPMILAHRPRW